MSQQANSHVSNQAVLIARPAAGENASFESQAGAKILFDFEPSTATVSRSGSDLVFQMDDGGSVTLTRFFEVGDQPLPSLVLPSGDEVASSEFLSAFDIDLITAAGPGAGSGSDSGGSGEYDDDSGSLLAGIDRLGSLGTLYWGRSTSFTEAPSSNALTSLELADNGSEFGGESEFDGRPDSGGRPDDSGSDGGGRPGVMALVLEITNYPQDADFKNSYGYYIRQYDDHGNEIAPKEGFIIWADVSNEENLYAQIILDFGGNITQKDIGFFIIPNGGGSDLASKSGALNPGLENGTKVIFHEGSAYTVDEDGNRDILLKGQNGWNLRLDTDTGSDGEKFVKYGDLTTESGKQEGNQHWEDLPKEWLSGDYLDYDDVNINVNWTMKSVVYNTGEDEVLAGSSSPDLFVWSSSAFGGTDTIENFNCAVDKLLFSGLLAGDSDALNSLLGGGSWHDNTFTATDGSGTSLNLSITGDTATLELTTGGNTQTIAIEGGIQPFIDNQGVDTATATLLQNIISISG